VLQLQTYAVPTAYGLKRQRRKTMGRPLNKKYFGNRNVGSASTTADDGIGGKSVASIPVTTASSYTTRPLVTLTGAPNLLSGVAATATITSEAATGATTTPGTGYTVGDTLTLSTAGGTAVAVVASITGGGATGPIGVVNFTGTGASRGSFEALPGVKVAAVGGTGTGAEITITFQAKSVKVLPGSGYTTTTPTAAATQSVVLGTVVMTTPIANTATVGSGFNPESAIIASAYTSSSSKQADIIKQVSTYRYKVKTSDGTVIAKLVTVAAAAPGSDGINQMTITATDSGGFTYYVQKLTSRKAAIVPYGIGTHQFPLNSDNTAKRVQWTLGTAVANTSVKLENG